MHVLFVHGMGRTPLSAIPLLWRLGRAGLKTHSFAYSAAFASFAGLRTRLVSEMLRLAARGDYVVIGHSLGGVLLRAAIAHLPSSAAQPRHVFLLGSPICPARMARMFERNWIYRALTGDCGRLLGSEPGMREIPPLSIPTTCIAGVRGLPWKSGPFRGEPNDGMVAVSEVYAEWAADNLQVQTSHTFLPSSTRVASALLARIQLLREMRPSGH